MEAEEQPLFDLADAVLDGRPLDWTAVASSVEESRQDLLPYFQTVAAIATFGLQSSLSRDFTATLPGAGSATLPSITWGPLTVLSKIGRGSFGDVYLALDPRLQRPVALKLLRKHHRGDDDAGSEVVGEGRLMARVRHPNVVTVYGAERIDGRVGLWMEFVDGRTLEAELRERGPLPPDEVVRIGIDLCRALGAIHRAGLLHRDLKAQNIMRDTEGRVLVTDFGAGLELTSSADGLRDLAGTPLYLAPEVLAGGAATVRSDIYSLGVLLFHLLTADYPVRGQTLDDLKQAHRQHRQRRLRDAQPGLEVALADAVERAIAADPHVRYAGATAMEEALSLIATAGGRAIEPARASGRRRWSMAWAAALVAASVAVAAAVGAVVMPRAWRETALARVLGTTRAPRKVRLPSVQMGWPSQDGRVYPYVDSGGNVQLWEPATGRSHHVTDADPAHERAGGSVMSPDGDSVVFAWSLPDRAWELRAVEADGTWPRTLVARETAYEPVPLDWSRDGNILCLFRQQNGSADLVLVPADGGAARVLYTFATGAPSGARLSPDGRFVAATAREHEEAPRPDLVIIGLDDSTPRILVESVANFSAPTWAVDGSHVFFLRESAEVKDSRDGWLQPVAEGRAQGAPFMVAPNLGAVESVHLTTDGLMHRAIYSVAADVYMVDIDLDGDAPPSAPTRISPGSIGSHVAPSWSPDGQSIAYFTIRPADAAGGLPLKTLTIQELATGQTRQLQPGLAFLGGYTPRWSPDSQSVVVWGKDQARDDRLGYYHVDAQTGETSPLVVGLDNDPAIADWAPDGREFFYLTRRRGIVAREISTGRERVVVANDDNLAVGGFRIAPDGGSVALTRWTDPDGEWTVTLDVQAIDGTSRELLRANRPEVLRVIGWTPDAAGLLYITWNDRGPKRLWRIPATGGEPTDMHLSIIRSGANEPNGPSLSPDGRRLAYPERVVQGELWIAPLEVGNRTSRSPR